MSLKKTRRAIDVLDSQILQLLSHRMELVLVAKKFKTEIQDQKREKEVLERIRKHSTGLIHGGLTEKIYTEIISESKRLQENDFRLIAFMGDHGAYGEVAAREWDKDLVPISCGEFAEVFDGVQSGRYDYGIVPVENTLGGAVSLVNQLLINTDLHVVGAVELSINLCLVAPEETDHRDILTVYSHPQALSQCRQFLARNRLEPVPYHDTAGAAKMLAEKRPKRAAAIASKLSAKLYNLEIIKENIEDLERNMTRFLVLSREQEPEEGDKCSVIFSTEHKAGTLFSVLELFARENINLTRIESIPNEPGDYAFFLDFEGSEKEERVAKAIGKAKEMATHFKVLGCYKEKKAA